MRGICCRASADRVRISLRGAMLAAASQHRPQISQDIAALRRPASSSSLLAATFQWVKKMARSRSVRRRLAAPQVQDLIPRPLLFADEDPSDFDGLRDAFLAELAPGTPYERALADDLVTLTWETIRHRRMRDSLIRAKARDLASGVHARGELTDLFRRGEGHEVFGSALFGPDPEAASAAQELIEEHGFSLGEIFAEAYRRLADHVERHERKLAELETRRRRLREEYDRLTAVRMRAPVEDAEIVG